MNSQELVNKAWSFKKEGKYAEALKFYSQAFDILISEASAYAHSQEGIFVDKEENKKKVRAILPKHLDKVKEYLKHDKVACTVSNNMAVIFAEMGDNESAKKFFHQSIDLTPDNIDYPDPKIGLEELKKL